MRSARVLKMVFKRAGVVALWVIYLVLKRFSIGLNVLVFKRSSNVDCAHWVVEKRGLI